MQNCEFCGRELFKKRTSLPEYMIEEWEKQAPENRDEFKMNHTEEILECGSCGRMDD